MPEFTTFCISGKPGDHSWVIGTKHNYCSACGLILEVVGINNRRRNKRAADLAAIPRYKTSTKKPKSKVQKLREQVAERDGNECWWCIMPGDEDDPLTLEHVPRLARGGAWRLQDLRLAHRSCNERRPVLDKLEKLG